MGYRVKADGFGATNDCIDRWARGDLDTSQGRKIEPFGPMLGSQIVFRVCKDRRSIPVLVMSRHCTSSGVTLQSCQARRIFNVNRVHRKTCIWSVTACRYRSLSKTSTQQRVSIRAKKWMGKNILSEKWFSCFCPHMFLPKHDRCRLPKHIEPRRPHELRF
jgi:hypothetical protein